MSRSSKLIVCALAASLVTSSVAGAPAVADPALAGHPAQVRASQQFDLVSKVNGKHYVVQVALPYMPPPPDGYPVFYVLDGDAYFATLADAARIRAALGREVQTAIVVGISYPEADSIPVILARRSADLTMTQPDADTRAADAAMPGPAPAYGGADDFLKMIRIEVAPLIATLAKIDETKTTLFGHSLGGLFVLHTLFTQPHAFHTYVAISPSIWWNGRALLNEEPDFAAKVASREVASRVFIGVGGKEEDLFPSGLSLPPGVSRERLNENMRKSAMISNARALATRLGQLHGADGYAVHFELFDRQSHTSVPWAAINTVLDFALPLATSVKP